MSYNLTQPGEDETHSSWGCGELSMSLLEVASVLIICCAVFISGEVSDSMSLCPHGPYVVLFLKYRFCLKNN